MSVTLAMPPREGGLQASASVVERPCPARGGSHRAAVRPLDAGREAGRDVTSSKVTPPGKLPDRANSGGARPTRRRRNVAQYLLGWHGPCKSVSVALRSLRGRST
jgi:hypothetical protein